MCLVLVGSRYLFAGMRWTALAVLAFWGVRKRSLTYWILLSMLLGAELGFDLPRFSQHLQFLNDIFLRLIKVIVVPLILASLISGIGGRRDLRSLRRVGLKALIYFEVITTLALIIGMWAIDISRAGVGVMARHAAPVALAATTPIRWDDFLVQMIPQNLVQSMADGQILQVVVFAVMFGVALSLVPERQRTPVLNFCESLTQTMFVLTNLVMYFAPFGVGAAMAVAVSQMGAAAMLTLLKLLLTSYAAFFVFIFVVLLPVCFWARVPVGPFLSAIAEPISIAFATSTSEAALPGAMEQMEAFGIPQPIVAFVLPVGYSFNMEGSTLYLALASIFVTQAAGIHMGWRGQIGMLLVLMLMSKGITGVPRMVLVVLTAMATMFHLPSEPIILALGIDALIDMGRTALNVLGNCLACAVIGLPERMSLAESHQLVD